MQLRKDLKWLVERHSRQNSQTSLGFLLPTSSLMNSNCFPNRRMPSSKMATSLGDHFSNTAVGVTGLIRMSRSRFLQRWLTVSRYSSSGFFFFSGLVLQTSCCELTVCRMGCFSSLNRSSSGRKGCSSLLLLARSSASRTLPNSTPSLPPGLSLFCFLCACDIPLAINKHQIIMEVPSLSPRLDSPSHPRNSPHSNCKSDRRSEASAVTRQMAKLQQRQPLRMKFKLIILARSLTKALERSTHELLNESMLRMKCNRGQYTAEWFEGSFGDLEQRLKKASLELLRYCCSKPQKRVTKHAWEGIKSQ